MHEIRVGTCVVELPFTGQVFLVPLCRDHNGEGGLRGKNSRGPA